MQPVRCDIVCFAIVVQLTDGRGEWSTDGCNLTGFNETTRCCCSAECDHHQTLQFGGKTMSLSTDYC